MESLSVDLPTWAASVAAVLALVFAWRSSQSARRMYHLESERDRLEGERRSVETADRLRSQAELISCWWEAAKDERPSGLFVRNSSGAPIYQLHVVVFSPDGRSDLSKFQVDVLPPRSEADHFAIDESSLYSNREEKEQVAGSYRARLTFTDTSGVRWERNQYGKLSRLGSGLLVQTDISRAEALGIFRSDFMNKYGVNVDFRHDARIGAREKFIDESKKSGEVVDAIIAPHDWIGSLVHCDAIESTILSDLHRSKFPQWTLDALTYRGLLYGLPTTLDAVALVRNTALAPEQPANFEEMLDIGKTLQGASKVDEVLCLRVGPLGDPFQMWPLFSSAGGQVLGSPDWNRKFVFLDSEESLAALDLLGRLGEKGAGILRRSMEAEQAFRIFNSGRSAFLVTTSDGLKSARKAGVPVAVSPVPALANGGTAVSLSLVHGLLMAKKGVNKLIAHDLFSEHLTQGLVMEMLSSHVVAPAARNGINRDDSDLRVYQSLCENGVPMPSFRNAHILWSALGSAQAAVIAGERSEAVGARAARELRERLTT